LRRVLVSVDGDDEAEAKTDMFTTMMKSALGSMATVVRGVGIRGKK
jgi:hypothetical protein